MKTIPAALLTHLQGGSITTARCWKLTRTDGQIFGFTDHDEDIVFSGVTYVANSGITPTDVETRAELQVAQLDAEGVLRSTAFTEAGVSAGLWDYAAVEVFRVNYRDLTMGREWIRRGWLGEVSTGRTGYRAEIRGLAQALQQRIVETAQPSCQADLFDARCKLNANDFDVAATVSTIVSAQRQWTSAGLAQAAGYFTWGKVLWLTGANAGLAMEVRTHASGGNILLVQPMPFTVAVGDTYTIWPGCQKRYTEDCGTKFNNQVNFRGFPHLPGGDQILKGVG